MDTVGWLAHLFLLGTEYINIINQSIGITVFLVFRGMQSGGYCHVFLFGHHCFFFFLIPGMQFDVVKCSSLGRERTYRPTHREKCCSVVCDVN